jgi:hypothetical protein
VEIAAPRALDIIDHPRATPQGPLQAWGKDIRESSR